MNWDRHSTIILALCGAILLFVVVWRKQIVSGLVPSHDGGLSDLDSASPVAYLGFNWGPPRFMQQMMPQTSQGGIMSPVGNRCGTCS